MTDRIGHVCWSPGYSGAPRPARDLDIPETTSPPDAAARLEEIAAELIALAQRQRPDGTAVDHRKIAYVWGRQIAEMARWGPR